MYVLIVTIKIKPGHKEAFMEAMLGDAQGSVQNEPGCYRFDVFQDNEDENTIYLNEVYQDEGALEAHTKMPHYLKWRETAEKWFAEPPQVLRCSNYFPTNEDWGKDWKKR